MERIRYDIRVHLFELLGNKSDKNEIFRIVTMLLCQNNILQT